MRKKFFKYFSFLCLWSIILPISAQTRDPDRSITRFLPAQTAAVCVIPNIEQTLQRANHSPLANIIGSYLSTLSSTSDSQGFFFQHLYQEGLQLLSVETSRGLSDHPAVVVLLPTDVTAGKENDSFVQFDIASVVNIQGMTGALSSLLENEILPSIQAQNPEIELEEASFEGIKTYHLTNTHFSFSYAIIDEFLLVTQNRYTLQTLLQQDAQETFTFSALNELPVFQDDSHDIRVYADLSALWKDMRVFFDQSPLSATTLDGIGLRDFLDQFRWPSLFWTFSIEPHGGYEQLELTWNIDDKTSSLDATHVPLLLAFDQDIVHHQTFVSDTLVSENVIYYGARHLDFPAAWQQVLSMSRMPSFPWNTEQFDQWVQILNVLFQMETAPDLLQALGHEIALVWYPRKSLRTRSRQPSSLDDIPLVLLLQIENQRLVQQALQNCSNALQLPITRQIFQEIVLQSLELPGRRTSFRLWFAFINDFLIVSGSEALLRESVRVALHKRSLAASQEYQTLSNSLPSQGMAKGYVNFSEFAHLLQNYLDRHAPFPDSRRHHMQAIRDITETLERLSGITWVTTQIDHSILTESHSPIGGTVVGGLITWALLSWMM